MSKNNPPKKVVAFLQNAWSPLYAGTRWPRDSWLKALWRSRSGQRLRILVENCPGVDFWWDNTTPEVSAQPSQVLPPDRLHMNEVLGNQKPDLVIALGRQAQKVIHDGARPWPYLMIPHPASRVVTNALYVKAAELIREGFTGWRELSQFYGFVAIQESPKETVCVEF